MGTRTRALFWALCALAIGVLAYLLGVGSLLGQRAEASVLDASAFTTDPPAPLSLVSPFSVIFVFIVIGLLALWVHGIGRAVTVLVSAATAVIASQILKENWLERPDLFELDMQNTFPSGHMTVFAALVAALCWAVPARWRGIMSAFGAVLLAVVAWQLLEYGWHRPSDVLGAQMLVVFAFAVAAVIGSRRSHSRDVGVIPTSANRVLSAIFTLCGILLTLGGVVLVGIAWGTRSDSLMLTAGEIALTGVSVISARVLARLCP